MKSILSVLFRETALSAPVRIAVVLGTLCAAAHALPVRYTLQNVAFAGGGTASGSFVFDADVAPACSTGASPCGRYSQVNITTTTAGGVNGSTYTLVCGSDVPTCTGVAPDSTAVLFLAVNVADETGQPALGFFFLAPGLLPPAGLSDVGGSFDVSNGAAGCNTAGCANEAQCVDAVCSAPAGPSRATNAGIVAGAQLPGTIPTLSEWGMILFAMLLVGYAALRLRNVGLGATAAVALLALASVSTVRAADQPESKPKPAPTEPAKPKTEPKADSQKENQQANEKGSLGANEKKRSVPNNAKSPWRPK